MKYLAILKDSLREAIDSKVLYVMVGLSLLVVGFVFTLSFKPQPAEQLMRSLVGGRLPDMMGHGGPHGPHRMAVDEAPVGPAALVEGPFELAGVDVLRGVPDSPDSDYVVTIRKSYGSPEKAAAVRQTPGKAQEALKTRFALFEESELLKISGVTVAGPTNRFVAQKDNPPQTVFFEATTTPTAATRRLWPHEPSLFFGAMPLGGSLPLGLQLFIIATLVLNIGAWVTVLVSIIITAFFIPNMLRKGTVDLLLVKPVRRWVLLVYKYFGGLTFIFLNTTVAIVGIWLALGLRSGIWANSFLLMIFVVTFFFAVLYAVSALFGVLTRSAIVAILMTCGAWFLFFIVGTLYLIFDQQRIMEETQHVPAEQRWSNNAFGSVVGVVHFVLPRTSDLNHLGQQLVLKDFLSEKLATASKMDQGTSISWGESLTASGAFVAVMLGLACWWFTTKDY